MNPLTQSTDSLSRPFRKARPPRPFLHSYWLEYDRILCGDHPFSVPGVEESDAMVALLKGGVRVFVDCSAEGEMPSYSELALRTAGDLEIDPASLSFHRIPVSPRSSPYNANHVREILRTIRLARVGGKMVYLHCANGHGRAGTMAGLLYREIFMFASTAALAQLDLSLHDYGNPDDRDIMAPLRFGETPETPCQRRFVTDWCPHRSISHREIRAAILGAAAAETFATPSPPPEGRERYHVSMILAMIDGLYLPGPYDASWTETQLDPDPLHQRKSRQVITFEEPGPPDEIDPLCNLPCFLPFALARYNCPDLIDRVGIALSHANAIGLSDPDSRFCAAFYCLVVSDLIHGSPVKMATQFARDALKDRQEFKLASPDTTEILDPDRLFEKPEGEVASPCTIAEILAAALWSVHHADDYRTSVSLSANLGGEVATMVSLAGGLAGIIHGEASIPGDWLAAIFYLLPLGKRCDEFTSYVGDASCLLIEDLPD